MKKKTDRGFSLIELIIAIAILIILTGLLAPQFMKYIEKSRKAACLNNVDVMIKEYQVAMIDNPDITPEEVLKTMVEHGMKCPSKGIYTVKKASDGETFSMNCSVHGNIGGGSTDPSIVLAEGVYGDMIEFVKAAKGKTRLEIEELLTKAGIDKNPSNDNIRKYLLKEVYGGSWPAADKNVFTKAENLYVQSYINLTDKNVFTANISKPKESDVITYIGTSKDDSEVYTNKWAAYYIYDYEEKCWYQGPNANSTYNLVTNKLTNTRWKDIKDDIKSKGWKPME